MLADYYRTFSTLDIRAIVDYFHEPAMLMGPAGVYVAPDRNTIATLLTTAIDGLRARGYGRSELDLEEVKLLSDSAALASGVARRYKADGDLLESVVLTYLLYKGDAGWKIAVLVIRDTRMAAE
jgi:ketosteroid isomerase-like protein